MCEILDGGSVPYYHLISNRDVSDEVLKGAKPKRPTTTPPSDELWSIMESCWQEPDQRPSFKEIHQRFLPLIPSESTKGLTKSKNTRTDYLKSEGSTHSMPKSKSTYKLSPENI